MKLVDEQGRSPEQRVKEILKSVQDKLNNSGKTMQVAINQTIRRHFQSIYPGSKHYAPEKVTNAGALGTRAIVNVDVPGITRAYKNLDIRPKKAKHLTIPMHREAYGLSPREVDGLFYAKNKRGTEMLAKIEGGALVVMYILKDYVHQTMDQRLMPSDQQLVDNIKARIYAYLSK